MLLLWCLNCVVWVVVVVVWVVLCVGCDLCGENNLKCFVRFVSCVPAPKGRVMRNK